jgi:transketolase
MNSANTSQVILARYSSLIRKEPLVRQGVLKLLAIKDSDIRILTLEQCRDAVDKGLHSGGAFSATIPLVSLFYGGFIDLDITDPTSRGQDLFILSKGHAVATLASIYADLGYFDRSLLKNSRSYESILNGHPGPLLPGVHISTGPMGQGFAVAQGFAIAGRTAPRFNSFCMVGDGELQEGPIWETVMYAAQKRLDNLCVLIDRNNGQLDTPDRMVFPMPNVEEVFSAFGWRALAADATDYEAVYDALEEFRYGPRNGKPTAIVCYSTKGQGGFSDFLNKHKVTINNRVMEQELSQQTHRREQRLEDFARYCNRLGESPEGEPTQAVLLDIARQMHLEVKKDSLGRMSAVDVIGPVLTKPVAPRDKHVKYDAALLPQIDSAKEYSASDIITAAMKAFARDPAVVSIDADLSSTSGLQAGVGAVDQNRALNTGVAEANMMNIGEAFAALGHNVWVSTFCPFVDWKVLRRIAVGYQERVESMRARDGWLTDGHGLDLTILATAPNFETRTNGATHMGNDDSTTFDAVAHLKIVDVSCPQQLLSLMKWIMEGNRGLLYVRIMRTGSAVLYSNKFEFEFGKAYVLRETAEDQAVIVSAGRGVHEALAAAKKCAEAGVAVGVVDMPSVDGEMMARLYDSGKLVVFAEQNNGYLWQNFLKEVYRRKDSSGDMRRILAINTLDRDGRPQFIHSGTYEQLVAAFGLAPSQIAETILKEVRGGCVSPSHK